MFGISLDSISERLAVGSVVGSVVGFVIAPHVAMVLAPLYILPAGILAIPVVGSLAASQASLHAGRAAWAVAPQVSAATAAITTMGVLPLARLAASSIQSITAGTEQPEQPEEGFLMITAGGDQEGEVSSRMLALPAPASAINRSSSELPSSSSIQSRPPRSASV